MAEKEKTFMPSGMAGLVRYNEETESLIKLKPEHVVAMSFILVLTEIILFLAFPI